MLRWQRKNGAHARDFWGAFFALSVFLHVLASGGCILYAYRSGHHAFTVHQIIDLQSARVVLRSVPVPARLAQNGTVRRAHAQPLKKLQAPTVLADEKTARKKIARKKNVKKNTKKKNSPAPKKIPVIKQQQADASAQQTEPRQEITKELPTRPEVEKVPIAPQPLDGVSTAPQSDPGPFEISYADAQIAQRYEAIHRELLERWAPPPGVADTCTCTVRVMVDRSGAVDEVRIEQPSGVLMFDISVRTALFAISWPQWAWGSSVVITFKP